MKASHMRLKQSISTRLRALMLFIRLTLKIYNTGFFIIIFVKLLALRVCVQVPLTFSRLSKRYLTSSGSHCASHVRSCAGGIRGMLGNKTSSFNPFSTQDWQGWVSTSCSRNPQCGKVSPRLMEDKHLGKW